MKIKTKINLAVIVVALVSIPSSVAACPVCPCEALYENEWWGDLFPAVQGTYASLATRTRSHIYVCVHYISLNLPTAFFFFPALQMHTAS